MSSFYIEWKKFTAMQEPAAAILGGMGLALALGWLMIGKTIPARWQQPARGLYIGAILLLAVYAGTVL